MLSTYLDHAEYETAAKESFGFNVDVDKIIVHEVDAGRAVKATVYLTKKKQLLCFIYGHSKLLLGDVQKIVARMGMRAELYLPPKGQPHYFDDIARQRFREVFPGKSVTSDDDLMFYRTLALYNPALAVISEVKDGQIYQFDADARGNWRPAAKFTYRRIKTS